MNNTLLDLEFAINAFEAKKMTEKFQWDPEKDEVIAFYEMLDSKFIGK